MVLKALFIPANPNDPIAVVELKGDDSMQAHKIHELVDGYFQTVPIPSDEIIIWCNEEGKLKGMPRNTRANELWTKIWGSPINDHLVGNIVITGGPTPSGGFKTIGENIVKLVK